MTERREVWITGVGLLTCLGEGLEANWAHLERGDPPPYDDKTFGIKLPPEQWTQEVNEGKATTDQYFVLKNLSEQIDKLIAAKGA